MCKVKNIALALGLVSVSSLALAGPNSSAGTITFNGEVQGECGFHHSHAEDSGSLGMTPSGASDKTWGDEGTIRYLNNTGSTGTLKLDLGASSLDSLDDNLEFKVDGAVGQSTTGGVAFWSGDGVELVKGPGNSSHNEVNISATVVDSDTVDARAYSVVSVWTVDCN
ncbi:hypothetical protein [Vibrio gallicus]|uniref:hypothetical protein n=1 Tax=Vibrio gallicus TaxID=190897 RepID=UPI0021C3F495|nr:hypothetical protein [Vibrio gallicus]